MITTTDLLGTVLGGAAAIVWLALILRMQLVAWRIYQIEEYDGLRLLRWQNQQAWTWHRCTKVATFLGIVGMLTYLPLAGRGDILPASWLVTGLVSNLLWRWTPPKKVLVWTSRMRRLGVGTIIFDLALLAALGVGDVFAVPPVIGAAVVIVIIFLPLVVILLALFASLFLSPVERRIRRRYLKAARARLAETSPTVVVVAGSWGKTSTKHALAAVLPAEAHALATRRSFNTLMGITRVINEDLTEEHKTFVVEMDPYARGEVATMCDLVHPQHAIITAVGAQHLERFTSVEAIGDAIFECVEALPEEGTAVIHVGSEQSAALLARAREAGRVAVGFGLATDEGPPDVVADDISQTADGISFTWRWPAKSLEATVRAPLLGAHHALNLTAALAMVHVLGHDVAQAAARCAQLTPVEHRLQRLPTDNGITVIDDSYNANPIGVHNGLEVLEQLAPHGSSTSQPQRILVTPGLVELGPEEDDENRRYGEHAARVCDHVVVTRAKTADALLDGLEAGGIEPDRVHLVDSLDQATAIIGEVARRGDVVLFANDLPDTYI